MCQGFSIIFHSLQWHIHVPHSIGVCQTLSLKIVFIVCSTGCYFIEHSCPPQTFLYTPFYEWSHFCPSSIDTFVYKHPSSSLFVSVVDSCWCEPCVTIFYLWTVDKHVCMNVWNCCMTYKKHKIATIWAYVQIPGSPFHKLPPFCILFKHT